VNKFFSHASSVAAFDFDGTLTTCDSLVPFIRYCYGSWSALCKSITLLPTCLLFACGLRSRQQVKEACLSRYFQGVPYEQVCRWGAAFASEALHTYLRPAMLQRLEWHQSQGHACVLISANVDVYLHAWAQSAGFDAVLCSALASDVQGRITGKLIGSNCWGPEKTRRLWELMEGRPRHSYTLYAYGDSRGDQELLAAADHAYYRYS
jgi:phosphatidylglycerophosphatase C